MQVIANQTKFRLLSMIVTYWTQIDNEQIKNVINQRDKMSRTDDIINTLS